ncbi:hypothetical protein TNCV_4414461 [Trichonephila clavipes]|uniref:Uncharacterized protein n=1 Tax=Trichonephila clavipes TaxID=2585209 RepID=A0A8X6VDY1_TRICX|nr:hypothetical protein TNCV_4414461 [Trichonephila clavipes]
MTFLDFAIHEHAFSPFLLLGGVSSDRALGSEETNDPVPLYLLLPTPLLEGQSRWIQLRPCSDIPICSRDSEHAEDKGAWGFFPGSPISQAHKTKSNEKKEQ